MTLGLSWIPSDDAGTRLTLARMADLVNGPEGQADPLVNETAHQIVLRVPPRDTLGYARAIRAWARSRFRFVPDPLDVETLRSPHYMLSHTDHLGGLMMGDCDCAALLAALGKAIGLPARFVVLGFSSLDNAWGHVYAELGTDQGWLDLDVTKPRGPVESPSRTMTYDV